MAQSYALCAVVALLFVNALVTSAVPLTDTTKMAPADVGDASDNAAQTPVDTTIATIDAAITTPVTLIEPTSTPTPTTDEALVESVTPLAEPTAVIDTVAEPTAESIVETTTTTTTMPSDEMTSDYVDTPSTATNAPIGGGERSGMPMPAPAGAGMPPAAMGGRGRRFMHGAYSHHQFAMGGAGGGMMGAPYAVQQGMPLGHASAAGAYGSYYHHQQRPTGYARPPFVSGAQSGVMSGTMGNAPLLSGLGSVSGVAQPVVAKTCGHDCHRHFHRCAPEVHMCTIDPLNWKCVSASRSS